MYDLPSENIEEPGWPDQYHLWQSEFLGETFSPPNFPSEEIFVASDLNLYYDIRHPRWYKRPDWFAVPGVPRFYQQRDSRLISVIWQQGISPLIVVELLSPSTEREDLGQTQPRENQRPTKWEASILRIPYDIIFNRYTDQLRVFELVRSHYQEISLHQKRLWLPEIKLGLGLWSGVYKGLERLWLRWYDSQERWVPTPEEQERQRAEQERQRAERLAEYLREMGINPDEI